MGVKFSRTCGITAALAAFVASVPVAAQQADGPTIEEIVVTAQKREQSLQDVPIAITAFGEGDLERLNAYRLSDLQYSTPNLTISPQNRSNLRVGLRGVSDFSRNPGYDNRVSVYVDGVYVGRSAASNQAALDIERVEVLRGPQGTLFGKNTVAGAINLTTSKPQGEFASFVELEAGNDSLYAVTGMLNGALVEDKLFAKAVINTTQRDGYVTNLFNGEDLNGLDDTGGRLQLRWLGEATEVNFAIESMKSDALFHGREAVPDPAAPAIYEVNFDVESLQEIDLFGASVTVDHEFANGYTLTSISGYRDTEFQNQADEDYAPLDISSSAIGEQSDHFSQEFRLASPADERYDYVVGLYYFDQTNDSTTSARGGALFPVPNSAVTVPATVDVNSWAVFFHGSYQLTDKLQLTGGLRYTYEEKEVDFTITDTTGLFTNGSFQDDRDADDLSPKIGLNYFLNDEVMFYGSYSKGFKSGGWNVDFLRTFEQIAFDDEEVDSYEAGVKSTLGDGRLRLNAAVYRMEYTDFQVFQFVPLSTGGTILTLTNAGEVTSQGLELDANWALSNAFTLWANFGYTDAEFDSFKDGGGPGVDYDDNKLPDAPETTYGLGIEGRFPVGPGGELVAQLDYSYRDDFFTNPNNEPVNEVDSYTLWNGRVGYESLDGTWSVYAWGRNLADSDDEIYKSVAFLGINRAVYQEPRMYGVTFRYNFGEE